MMLIGQNLYICRHPIWHDSDVSIILNKNSFDTLSVSPYAIYIKALFGVNPSRP